MSYLHSFPIITSRKQAVQRILEYSKHDQGHEVPFWVLLDLVDVYPRIKRNRAYLELGAERDISVPLPIIQSNRRLRKGELPEIAAKVSAATDCILRHIALSKGLNLGDALMELATTFSEAFTISENAISTTPEGALSLQANIIVAKSSKRIGL